MGKYQKMQTFNLSIISLIITMLIATTPAIAISTVLDFIQARGAKSGVIEKIMSEQKEQNICFVTNSHLICVSSKFISDKISPTFEQSIIKRLPIIARNQLYKHFIFTSDIVKVLNKNIYYNLYIDKVIKNGNKYNLSGVEFSTSKYNRYIYCAVAVNYRKSIYEFNNKLKLIEKNEYYNAVFLLSKKMYDNSKFEVCLKYLQELYKSNVNNKELYFLLSKCYNKLNNKNYSFKFANKILNNYNKELNAEEARELGNIFLSLKADNEAIAAFTIANKKLLNNN